MIEVNGVRYREIPRHRKVPSRVLNKIRGIDVVSEFELIQKKESKLSRIERDIVVGVFFNKHEVVTCAMSALPDNWKKGSKVTFHKTIVTDDSERGVPVDLEHELFEHKGIWYVRIFADEMEGVTLRFEIEE